MGNLVFAKQPGLPYCAKQTALMGSGLGTLATQGSFSYYQLPSQVTPLWQSYRASAQMKGAGA